MAIFELTKRALVALTLPAALALGACGGEAAAQPEAAPSPSQSDSATPSSTPTPTPTPTPAESRTFEELWSDGYDAGYAGKPGEDKPYWTPGQRAQYVTGYDFGKESAAEPEEELEPEVSTDDEFIRVLGNMKVKTKKSGRYSKKNLVAIADDICTYNDGPNWEEFYTNALVENGYPYDKALKIYLAAYTAYCPDKSR